MSASLALHALPGLPEITAEHNLPSLLAASVPPGNGILVVAQKVVSKWEGRLVDLRQVKASARAEELARQVDKDPRQIEVILGETARVVRAVPGVVICETHHGLICANAGVDLSNTPGDDIAILLPVAPDASAERVREALGPGRGVVISDTFGRPWRAGLVAPALGIAGFRPRRALHEAGARRGRELQVTIMALADQLAAAAGILMEKNAGIPAVWVEGVAVDGSGSLADLLRDPETDLFR